MTEAFRHPDELTPELLTRILKAHGALVRGEAIKIVLGKVELGSAPNNRHVEVFYSPNAEDTAPTHLFLKLVVDDYRSEVGMYKYVFPLIDQMPVPRCYAADYYPDRRGSYLLLEDISATHHSPEYGPGCTWPQVSDKRIFEQTMDGYAKVHAFCWGDWPLEDNTLTEKRNKIRGLPERLQKVCDTVSVELSQHIYGFARHVHFTEADLRGNINADPDLLEDWLAFMGDQFTERQRELYRKIVRYGQDVIVKRVLEGRHLTIIQQDAKPDQSLYPNNPDTHHVCIADWDSSMIGYGPYDLARHMCRFSREFRHAVERDLVTYYYNRLIEYGVENYSWDDCWYDYRLGLLRIVYPQYLRKPLREPFEHWEGQWGWINMNEVLAFEDLNCEELFEGGV